MLIQMTLTGHPGSPVLDQISTVSMSSCAGHPLFMFSLLKSLCTTSIHVLLRLPRPLLPSTSIVVHLFTQSSSDYRSTCPNHRNLLLTASTMLSIPSLFLKSELVHLSHSLTPHINHTIVISFICSFLSVSADTAKFLHHTPYNFSHTLYILSLSLSDLFPWHTELA